MQYEQSLGAQKAPANSGAGFGTPIPVANPDSTGQPTPNLQTVQDLPQKTPADIQAQADALHNAPIDSGAPTRSSTNIADNFAKMLESLGAPPKAPSAEDTYNKLQQEQGVPGIQQQIAELDKQIASAQADTQNTVNQEKGRPVAATIINGRVRMISAEADKAINDAKLQKTQLVNQLNNANSAITKIMSLQSTDYNRAHQTYIDQYNKAFQLFTAANTQASKEQTQASANAKVIISSYKGNPKGASSITEQDRANFANMEAQAGLPAGFIEAAIKAESTAGVKVDHWSTGADGTTYAYGTDAQGNPMLLKSFAGTGKPSSSAANPSDQKVLDSFNKSISTPPKATETREQYARRLQAQYPKINPDDILRKVYDTYPDGYDKGGTKNSSGGTTQQIQ